MAMEDREMTREEIAQELGVTGERVRQIENQALAKVRRGFENRGFSADDAQDYLRAAFSRQSLWENSPW